MPTCGFSESKDPLGLTLPVRGDVMGKDRGIMGSVHTEGTWQGDEVPRP